MDRREFLGWLGAASGASLLAGCDLTRKSEKIIPYLVPPDDGVIPGEATFVATSCTECPVGCGVSARIRDARPVKVDGLAGHPVNDGALCIRGQASLNRMYHTERIRQPLMQDGTGKLAPATWNQVLARTAQALKQTDREHVMLSGRTSGSLDLLMDEFASRAGVRRLPEFELFSYAAIREANRSLFDRAVVPSVHPERADVVVTVGADVIETYGSAVAFSTELSRRRDARGHFAWFHLEPHASMSGFKATHRLVVRPGTEGHVLAFLLHTIAERRSLSGRIAAHVASVPAITAERAAEVSGLAREALDELAHALADAHAPLLLAGGVSTAQETGLDVARLAALIQSACGMHGSTVDLARVPDYSRMGSMADIERLGQRLDADQVGAMILFGVDPVAQVPDGAKFAASLDRAAFLVGVGTMLTPTLERCDVVLPLSHALESWGDVEPVAGVVNVIQPAIAPLFDTLADGDVLLRILAEMSGQPAATYQQYVLDRWARDYGPSVAQALVTDGFAEVPSNESAGAALREPDHRYTFDASGPIAGPVLVVAPSVRWYDGRSRVLDLLNEIPDPLTAVSWGDWVSVGMETAAALGVTDQDEVELRAGTWSGKLTVRRQPGLARDVFVVQRGVAAPAAGWSRTGGEANAVIGDVSVSRAGTRNPVAILAGSHTDQGRGIVPGSHAKHFGAHPRKMEEMERNPPAREDLTFYPVPSYPNYRWAMAVDMEKCVGCSACVAACYIENNVPMTGHEQHLRGREMSWIRLEPYYAEDGSTADFVPAMCQHCDFAPCEPVCPVYATYHNDEGLNVQVYNRCVGTRYCMNNCSYKQRRFNFFSYEHRPHPLNLMTNPDVSMRGKGMMEKCTFCVQRIRKARDVAKDEKRGIQEGEITPACAQACPGKAIVFGNLLDESSEVYRWAHDQRSSRMLEELGTGPAVFYLNKGTHHGA
jgi:molybdopterin-containing oxidoreductase family iron-sulfur binding subunit